MTRSSELRQNLESQPAWSYQVIKTLVVGPAGRGLNLCLPARQTGQASRNWANQAAVKCKIERMKIHTFLLGGCFLWHFYPQHPSKLFSITCQEFVSNLNLFRCHVIDISIILNSTDVLISWAAAAFHIAQPVGLKCITTINQVHQLAIVISYLQVCDTIFILHNCISNNLKAGPIFIRGRLRLLISLVRCHFYILRETNRQLYQIKLTDHKINLTNAWNVTSGLTKVCYNVT